METTDSAETGAPPPVEEMQRGWHELLLRVGKLEAEKGVLEQENKTLRQMLERVIEHRQRSHSELVMVLTGLVSKLPLNDVGVIVSKLVEHNANVSQYLAALIKGTVDARMPELAVLKNLDHTKRDLVAALKPALEELIRLDTPLEPDLLQSIEAHPDEFFSPRAVRATRCFLKGQLPRERVVRDFGEAALVFFYDLTTDPKLNPRPKPDEIVLAFRNDFEAVFQQDTSLPRDKREALWALYERVQRSKAPTEAARAQRNVFQRVAFLIELLHFYEHQNTEAPDVIFAQRLPVLVEQLVLAGPQDSVDEKLVAQAESLLGYIINPDHRQAVVNNIGKGGGAGRTLKFVLKLRSDKVADLDETIVTFVKHLIPPQSLPTPQGLGPILRLIHPEMQRLVLKFIRRCDRLRKEEGERLANALADVLGIKGWADEAKAQAAIPPEMERQLAWGRIKELITSRTDPATVAAAFRDRLHAKYDADEIRQSWLTMMEADPLSLIRIFSHVPFLPDGTTDPIARTVIDTYVSRLTHEKYAATYHKVATSLKNMYRAKPDSPTLVNFLALVRWVNPDAANRLAADAGMPLQAHLV